MSEHSFKVIAIDGGAATGKSSTSKRLASALNLLHVDTGSHYRAVTHSALREGLEPSDSDQLTTFLQHLRFDSLIEGHAALVRINGNLPGPEDLRSEQVNANVSKFAAIPAIRSAVKSYQRAQAQVARENGFNGLIMDGRDIGTVIFPDANLKIFLQADPSTREARRASEGQSDAIAARDTMDTKRTTAPLIPASDAVIIDNSNLTLDQVVEKIISLIDQ